jgi:transposase
LENGSSTFQRWAKSGVFERIVEQLASDHDNEYMMIDATIVRAHQHSAGARKKRRASPRQIARRIEQQDPRARRCPLGNPFNLMLTPGQALDLTAAEPLLETADPCALISDKTYDFDPLIDLLDRRAITPVIPPRENRKERRYCDFALYRERNLPERFWNKIKHYRAIATRYDVRQLVR